MVRFIRPEAEEKANEIISVSAEEEFNIEKLQLAKLEKEKDWARNIFAKFKQVEVRKKCSAETQRGISVLLRRREVVACLVQYVLNEAKKEYADKVKVKHPPNITVDKCVPSTTFNEHRATWSPMVIFFYSSFEKSDLVDNDVSWFDIVEKIPSTYQEKRGFSL